MFVFSFQHVVHSRTTADKELKMLVLHVLLDLNTVLEIDTDSSLLN